MVTEPLLDTLPMPVVTSIEPPVAAELVPDNTLTPPPAPLLPLPTLRNRAPPRPDVAAPLPMYTAP
eukprot:40955-Eustigmatos_ZCMA.PRE.1